MTRRWNVEINPVGLYVVAVLFCLYYALGAWWPVAVVLAAITVPTLSLMLSVLIAAIEATHSVYQESRWGRARRKKRIQKRVQKMRASRDRRGF